jgi:lactoylglutathione lyase
MTKPSIAALYTGLAHFVLPSIACIPPTNDTSGGIQFGSDEPADPATTGYFINHFSLNTKNLTACIDFYTGVFGLRHMFSLPASEHLTIAYLGHAQGGRNGIGYQTSEEMVRGQTNSAGLIEVIHLDIPNEDIPASSEKTNTFGHIGVVVPDTEAAQARLENYPGVRILKRVGDPTPSEGEIAIANGFPPSAWEQISIKERAIIEATLSEINLRFLYVADPDGNILEVQPLL